MPPARMTGTSDGLKEQTRTARIQHHAVINAAIRADGGRSDDVRQLRASTYKTQRSCARGKIQGYVTRLSARSSAAANSYGAVLGLFTNCLPYAPFALRHGNDLDTNAVVDAVRHLSINYSSSSSSSPSSGFVKYLCLISFHCLYRSLVSLGT